jgi:hypothetical protein
MVVSGKKIGHRATVQRSRNQKKDKFLIEPRSGGQNCSPGWSEAEPGVNRPIWTSPGRGDRRWPSHPLAPLRG